MQLHRVLGYILSHPLNKGQQLLALARFGVWQIRSRLAKSVEHRWIEDAVLVASRGMTGASGNIYCGLHEFVDMAFVMHFLRREDLFVDVGANIGSYTVLAGAVCGSRVVALEPSTVAADALRRNIAANRLTDTVAVVEVAVGSRQGTVRFTSGRDTTNKVVEAGDEATVMVPLETLDAVLEGQSPAVIKMDVEGYEAEAIRGARAVLRQPSLKAVLLETVDPWVEQVLADSNFRQVTYDPFSRAMSDVPGFHPQLQSNNSIFVRDADFVQKRLLSATSRVVHGWEI